MPNKLLMLSCLLLPALVSLSFLHNRPIFMSDTVTYVEAAKSLAAGNGYATGGSPVTIWPPGYSVFLALPIAMGLNQMVVFKALNILMAVLACLCFGFTFRKSFSDYLSWLVLAATALIFPWIYYTHLVGSEMLFTLVVGGFCLASVVFLQTRRLSIFWLMTLLAAFAPLIRFAGIALFPVWLWCVIDLTIFQRKANVFLKKWIHMVGAGVLLVLPLMLYLMRNRLLTGTWMAYRVAGNEEYLLSLARIGIDEPSFLIRLWINIRGYWHIFVIPDQVGISRIGSLPLMIQWLAGLPWLLVAVGAFRNIKGVLRPAIILLIPYGGMLLLNCWYDMRYLVPILPIVLVLMLDGAGQVASVVLSALFTRCGWREHLLVRPVFWSTLCAILLATANLGFAVYSPQASRLRNRSYEGTLNRLYNACLFLKTADVEGSVMVAGGGGFIPIWTGRPIVSILSFVQDGKLHLQDVPDTVSYLLLDESEFMPYRKTYMDPWFETVKERFQLVFQENETKVWLRIK